MEAFTSDTIRRLAHAPSGPCLTVYASLTPGRAIENRTRLKNLAKKAAGLLATMDDGMADWLLAPLRQWGLYGDWTNMRGLAYMASPDGRRTVALRSPTVDRVALGSVFLVRPLLRGVCDKRYFLLALSHRAVRLYRGTVDSLQPVDVPGMPAGIEDAQRNHDTDEPLTFHSFRRGNAEAIFHGHGVGIDDHKDDLVSYFRAVDRALHPLLREESDPLLLAGVDYLFPLYAEANTYSHLAPRGLPGNADHATPDALHRATWPLVADTNKLAAKRAVQRFRQAQARGRASCDVRGVVEAAIAGGVESLLLTPRAEAWGHYDAVGCRVVVPLDDNPGDEELWNLAAVHVLRHRGEVYEVDPEDLEGPEAAAVLRMPIVSPEAVSPR